MKAIEAKQLTEKNKISIEVILKRIEGDAKLGNWSTHIFEYVDPEIYKKLFELGYKLRNYKDERGCKILFVEWD